MSAVFCKKIHELFSVGMQGDEFDSSDEEWDTHIGRHGRAFLGLNEPIAEIPLDNGVGIGMMVRNAFAHADNIHSNIVQLEVGEADASQEGHSERMSSDTDMNDNSAPSLGSPLSESSDSLHQEAFGHGSGFDRGGSSTEEANSSSSDNADPDNELDDGPSEEDWEASDEETSDADNLEDLLGQIPPDRMGSTPEFDIAATLPLYEGSTLSMLCATLLIVNCCKTHGVSNMFMNELLMLLSMSILPTGNCLPKTEYEASKILRRLGLAYKMIHACPNGCCLFKGDLEDSEKCPVCEADSYRQCGRSRVPSLILRHFPLIPQLQRMFSSKRLSKLNVWHHYHKSVDGKMRHTADSPQWNFVHTDLEPEAGNDMFGRDPRDIHLGLAVDGMNPYSEYTKYTKFNPSYHVQLQSASVDGNQKVFCDVMPSNSNQSKSNRHEL